MEQILSKNPYKNPESFSDSGSGSSLRWTEPWIGTTCVKI